MNEKDMNDGLPEWQYRTTMAAFDRAVHAVLHSEEMPDQKSTEELRALIKDAIKKGFMRFLSTVQAGHLTHAQQ